jgi:hypothetical protein
VRAPQSEIDQEFSRCGEQHARCLGRDQRLIMQQIDNSGFNELRLRQRRGYAQDRLVGKKYRTLGHCMHVPAEAEVGKSVEQRISEAPGRGKPIDVLGREPQPFQVIEDLFEPGCDQKSPSAGKLAEKEFKHSCLRVPMLEIRLQHVELI